MSSQQVIDFVSNRISQGQSLAGICEALTDNCLATDSMNGIGCDNMTVLICAIVSGSSEEEWRSGIMQRVSTQVPAEGIN